MLYAFLATQAVAWTTYGLVPFVRQFLPGLGVLLFVLLSIPSSGGAIPVPLAPRLFRFLNPVLPLGNLIDALRAVLYFHDHGLLRPTLVLCAWITAGALLIAARAWRQRHWQPGSRGVIIPDQALEHPAFQHPHPHAVRPGQRDPFGASVPELSGRASRVDGTPVADAPVTVLDTRGNQLVRTRTDGDGRYATTGLPEAALTVVLLAQGYAPGAVPIVTRQGHLVRQDFVLHPARRVTPGH
jgi:Carboxypeptidase regulatory-like domain